MSGERTDTQVILGAVETTREHLGREIGDVKVTVAKHDRMLRGHNGEPGVLDHVRDLSRRFDTMTKLAWIITGSVVTAAITLLVEAWVK